jgi:hypothetical protein
MSRWHRHLAALTSLAKKVMGLFHRPARGSPSPPAALDLERILEQLRLDPEGTRRLIHETAEASRARFETRLAELRGRAHQDIEAALALRKELTVLLRSNAHHRNGVRRSIRMEGFRGSPESELRQSELRLQLNRLEMEEHALQSEISELDRVISQLKPH